MLGTFDPEFGRNRQLARLAESTGMSVTIQSFALWSKDKVTEAQKGALRTAILSITVYARLSFAVIQLGVSRSRRPDALLIPHPSQIDAVIVGLLARIVRLPVVIDYFVSLHETVVTDRALASPQSFKAKILRCFDKWAAQLATIVITDTPQDAVEFAIQTRTRPAKWKVVRVGADPHLYFPLPNITPEPRSVLFYGTYIPLQGIEHIVRSSLLIPREYTITLVGNGQLRNETEILIRKLGAPIQLKDQVPESELALLIAGSQVCLGVFGAGAKTQRVIPNKVYQCLAVGRPVITCHSPAIKILGDAVLTVSPGNPEAIATAIKTLVEDDGRREAMAKRGRELFQQKFSEEQLRTDFSDALASLD